MAKPIPDYLLEKYRASAETEELLEDSPDLIAILGLDHADKFKLPKLAETATSTEETATSTEETIE